MDFVVSDSSLNKYGFRVLTEGGDFSEFIKNPVMLYNHDGYSNMPIGRWENLRVDGDKLIATAVFDENDELALKVKSKAEQRILNATSLGLTVVEWSDDPSVLVQGQTRSTVTKWKLREISMVVIPANGNAMRLYDNGKSLQLGDMADSQVETILPKIKRMKTLAIALGLKEDASENEVLLALKKVQAQASAFAQLFGKVSEERGFTPETIKRFADADPEGAVALVLGKPSEAPQQQATLLSDAIKEAMKGEAPKAAVEVSLGELSRTAPKQVQLLLDKEPEKYAEMFFKEYGYKPSVEELFKLRKA